MGFVESLLCIAAYRMPATAPAPPRAWSAFLVAMSAVAERFRPAVRLRLFLAITPSCSPPAALAVAATNTGSKRRSRRSPR